MKTTFKKVQKGIVGILLTTLVLMFLITQCFHLLNLPSDIAVVLGILGICVTFFSACYLYPKIWKYVFTTKTPGESDKKEIE